MYRPWWFPEYNPKEQKVFDAILEVIASVFKQHNYDHIWTPAVESVDILSRGGDIFDKQVYGLYGLAQVSQWEQDYKDYALHFDLTIPLARYVLDHRNDLVFPFRRYQMQPVWRGERTKRGRFKEFRQFDIDAVWPAESNVGVRYDIETIAVMDKAMQAVCDQFAITIDRIVKISHVGVTKAWLRSIDMDESQINSVLWLLDNYFKIGKETFADKIHDLIGVEKASPIIALIDSKDTSVLAGVAWYDDLSAIMQWLDALGTPYEYDVCIVRGHSYYKGMVCERFEKTDVALGSLAAWGRYDQITDFIDPKQSFSGVGTSLGRFVYSALEKIGSLVWHESYMLANFAETWTETLALYTQLTTAGKICELYPTSAKLGKQIEYASKKWCAYVVIFWPGEQEKWVYIIKDLQTGEQNEEKL